MDCDKVGKLIFELRKEKHLTQKQLAEIICVSEKTVSKWERGAGCPDVSLLCKLSEVFGVNIEKLLLGELDKNNSDGGNMKRVKFFVCPSCGNILSATGTAEISCCGKKLAALTPKQSDSMHKLNVEKTDDEFYITFEHPMNKEHFISFLAYATYDRVHMVRMYPEQGGEVRMPQLHGGKLYFYCSNDGFFVNE